MNMESAGPVPQSLDAGKRRSSLLWVIVPVGLAISYSPMWLPRVREAIGVDIGLTGPMASILWNALAVLVLVAYMVFIERRRPWASVGLLKPSQKHVEWALYLFGIYMGWQWIVLTFFPPPADSGTAAITSMSIAAVLALIVSAAVFEEVLYRGYPIERLTELTGHRWIALLITVPLFMAPHVAFFGPQWLWTQGIGAIALFVLYAKTRNLLVCMLLHLCINLPILIPTIAQHIGA
ncbi:CPBP family intramembrane metalloprotease [Arthrobacter sp. 260]|nr:CPBP family intramembrane metalloprotease [Arthrobacter sp. 260]